MSRDVTKSDLVTTVQAPAKRPLVAAAAVDEFSPYVAEQLGYYVYLLKDPRDGAIFYVGKGAGNRVFAHARDALDDQLANDKLDRIRDIRAAGHRVSYELLRFGLTSREAFEVEAAAIQLLGLSDLLNIVGGHHAEVRGRMSVEDAVSLIDAPPVENITEPLLLIKIPKLWYPSIPDDELLEATAGWWKIGIRRERARYAACVIRGVIRQVYAVDSWRQRVEGDRDWQDDIGKVPRWGFSGRIAPELAHYRNRSVRHLYQQGEASPIKYVNC